MLKIETAEVKIIKLNVNNMKIGVFYIIVESINSTWNGAATIRTEDTILYFHEKHGFAKSTLKAAENNVFVREMYPDEVLKFTKD